MRSTMALPAAAAVGGAPPVVSPAVPVPPALPATLAEWCGANADPCGDPGQLLCPFRDPPNLVDTIHASLTTATHPLPLLVNGADGKPHVVTVPLDENTLPGQPVGGKFSLMGDVSDQGAMLSLMSIFEIDEIVLGNSD